MIKTRPRRRFDAFALALDAPLPIQPTCAGMRLLWPAGDPDEARNNAGNEARQTVGETQQKTTVSDAR